jgi:putative nucleotidyltransferase with HDIG domain
MLASPTFSPETKASSSGELPGDLAQALARKLDDGSLDLPVLADAAQRVMRMALDEDVDPTALSETIKRDGAMASHLLRVANSPLYRGRAAIVSLQQAVSRLGMSKVREIALAVVCESRVFRVRGYDAEVRGAFRHSLAAAYFAGEIARVKRTSVEEAFLCGLLHDIGRPVLLQAIVDLERELSVRAPHVAALSAADAHHEAVGAALVLRWELPPRVADAVRRHHHAPEGPDAGTQALVALADELGHLLLEPNTVSEDSLRESPLLGTLNLYPEEFAGILATKTKVRSIIDATP